MNAGISLARPHQGHIIDLFRRQMGEPQTRGDGRHGQTPVMMAPRQFGLFGSRGDDAIIEHHRRRIAFGEPISNRQAVAFAVADIATELEGMRLLTYRAASRVDQGQTFAREAALARRLCAEKAMAIGSAGVQLLGGHGYIKEHPVERWYRDLRSAGVMEGALLV